MSTASGTITPIKDKAQDYANRAYTQVKETAHDAAAATATVAGQAADKAVRVADKAKDYANRAYSQVKETVQDAASTSASVAGQAADKVKEYASEATEKVKDFANATSERATEMGREVIELVRKHPVMTMLSALGVGILIGRILKK